MEAMLEVFREVHVRPINHEPASISAYYCEVPDLQRLVFDSRSGTDEVPTYLLKRYFPICNTLEDSTRLKQFNDLSNQFTLLLEESQAPLRVPRCLRCCFRGANRTSLGVMCTLLFGDPKQLGFILQRMFAADHHWVPVSNSTCSGKPVKLDCMFFKSASVQEQTESDWQARPTFIVCNSNAMFYQQMVHESHSFYLKFFLDRGINVFIWNYRNYGRSKGTPDPASF